MFDDQHPFRERLEWGPAGVQRLAPLVDVVVIVDVLSFSTTVEIALSRGATVFPYRKRGDEAARYAAQVGAELADGRRSRTGVSLSPESMTRVAEGTRLVLPSPNGATLTLAAAALNRNVLIGSLRNAAAVARACRALGETVAIVPAGERWVQAEGETGTLRPAIEDLIGAGAILNALPPANPSPEAEIALAAFERARSDLAGALTRCASGRELIERGFGADIALAAALNVSSVAPRLDADRIVDSGLIE
jgi:2-phosphosulfolactate phosphatase